MSKLPRKSICLAVCLLSLSAFTQSTLGGISFNFVYPGPIGSGVGFEDTAQGQARRNALQAAADQFGGLFLHNATIDIEATSFDDPNDFTLASATSRGFDPGVGSFGTGVIREKVLNGIDRNAAVTDGVVDVNWGNNWEISSNQADIDGTEFDFFSTMFHELAHALGFSSDIFEDGTDTFGTVPGNAGTWAAFDRFITDVNGNPVINPANPVLDQTLWDTQKVGGPSPAGGLFFNGPNAAAANGGNPVGLFTPNPFQDGSSVSHLDDDNPALADLLMASVTDFGPTTRTLSDIEWGIFADLGYTKVPEPAAGVILILGIAGLLSRRVMRR